MKISPRELREAQIPSKAFGFNQDVVDALLERAADTIEGLIEENRQLFEALERMRSEGSEQVTSDPFEGVKAAEPEVVQAEPVQQEVAPATSVDENLLLAQVAEKEELINKTLLLAQKTADETLKTAKEQADELVAAAKANADELVALATAEAQSVTGTASEKAQQDLELAQEKAQTLVQSAQDQADELVATAQAQADSIHAQEREKFENLVAELTKERAQLLSDIEILQTFDETHRNKLREIVEQDLQTLVSRPPINVGAIPELIPVTIDVPKPSARLVSEPEPQIVEEHEIQEVAHSAIGETFDDIVDSAPVVEPASADDIDDDLLFSEDMEAEVIESEHIDSEPVKPANYDGGDPFAAFVDAPSIVSPAGADDEQSGRVAEGPSGQVESTNSSTAFDPGSKAKSKRQENLDDDDFFASLREAVADDSPLGPSDDEDDQGGKFKGLFKK